MNKQFNMLLDDLPKEIKGKRIHYDFRTLIKYEMLLRNEELTESEKIEKAIKLFYIDMPENLQEAIEDLNWFYQCGKQRKGEKSESQSPAYDFACDDEMLYSSFFQDYGVKLDDLTDLHWWSFIAMMSGLSDKTIFKTAVGYRVADTSKMSKEMKEHYERCKEIFAINQNKNQKFESMADRNKNFILCMRKRVKDAHKQTVNNESNTQ